MKVENYCIKGPLGAGEGALSLHTRMRLKDLGETQMTQFAVRWWMGEFSYGETHVTKFTV